MSARNPGMSKTDYIKAATPGKSLQMPIPKTPKAGTVAMAKVNPVPKPGVTYGVKPGLHVAPTRMPTVPKAKMKSPD